MNDLDKTKEQLVNELLAMRQRIAALEARAARSKVQLETAVGVFKSTSAILDPPGLMHQAVNLIQESFGLCYVGLFLVDESGAHAILRAATGETGRKMLARGHRVVAGGQSMIGWCVANAQARIALDMRSDNPDLPETRSKMALPLVSRGRCIGALTVQSAEEAAFAAQDITVLQTMADQLAIAIENAQLFEATQREIAERKQAEETLRQRNRELALLNRLGRGLSSTLDLDQVLVAVLEEVRRLLKATAGSVWLVDPLTHELVCRHATGPRNEIVRGWRLAHGEGIAGWVARTGQSLLVPDTRTDERHFKGVDQQTGMTLRSILSVPLRARSKTMGTLQVADALVKRFQPTDLVLLESLAATAAIAIDNARLYEQAQWNAATRAVLLDQVNHRVKNNLSTIIGLLYAARRYVEEKDQLVYLSIMNDLVSRVQGLATVHSLLSASQWTPLLLNELTTQVIRSTLQAHPHDKQVFIDVSPSTIQVTPAQANNLALVINELTSNTIKYALPGRDAAHITVRIASDGATISLEFRDDGPGYPTEVLQLKRYSVGFDLIQNIVRKNMIGKLSLRNEDGAVAKIKFSTEV